MLSKLHLTTLLFIAAFVGGIVLLASGVAVKISWLSSVSATITVISLLTDNYYKPRNWLDEHRFYLNAKQCERINVTLNRINNLPLEVGEIRFLGNGFEPHSDMDESYFLSAR